MLSSSAIEGHPYDPCTGTRQGLLEHRYQRAVADRRRPALASRIVGIEFVGYAGDCRIFGRLPSLGERLTDLLNAGQRVVVRDARLESLADGHIVAVPLAEIEREELCAVVANGPRGARQRRIRTSSERIRVDIGPYVVLGNLHAPAELDPMGQILRREMMVPLTNATIAYTLAGRQQVEDLGTVIINRMLAESLGPIEEEPARPALRLAAQMRFKDFTDLVG